MTFISINRNDKTVKDENGVPLKLSCIGLEWNCGDEMFAALLVERLRNNLKTILKKAREDSYNEGWRNAKAKQWPKRTEHSGYQP